MTTYVHGYDAQEGERLRDQADTLQELLHGDTHFLAESTVLEAGCGVGAQTVILAQRNPTAHIVAVDLSIDSLQEAQRRIASAGITNVQVQQADLFDLPFPPQSFDHIFVCFVLEHLADPQEALRRLATVLKPNGTITVIEGDHGSALFFPPSEAAQQVITSQVTLQQNAGGNALIGRQLYPLVHRAGLVSVQVSPRVVYVDATRPHVVEGFIKKTFIAMMEGVREAAVSSGLIEEATFDQGIRDLYRTTEADGVFSYTFFKAVGTKPTPHETE